MKKLEVGLLAIVSIKSKFDSVCYTTGKNSKDSFLMQ